MSSIEPSAPITGIPGLPQDVRINAVLGDSHAALYGHGVRTPGGVKVTYGSGSSIMGLVPLAGVDESGMVRTIAWSLGKPVYAFEGNILSTGSTLVWLAGLLGVTVAELTALAEGAGDSRGVVMVPAFAGLGAPVVGRPGTRGHPRHRSGDDRRPSRLGRRRVDRSPSR